MRIKEDFIEKTHKKSLSFHVAVYSKAAKIKKNIITINITINIPFLYIISIIIFYKFRFNICTIVEFVSIKLPT